MDASLFYERRKTMLKKTITYIDYNNNERTEDFYFNLTKAEVMEMEMSVNGGLTEMIQKIIATQDAPAIIKIFKDLILKSYGEKSLDGKQFNKSDELAKAFSQTEAYSQLFMELATDANAASDFVNGIIPSVTKSNSANADNGSVNSLLKPAT
jgi:hypothetical protein